MDPQPQIVTALGKLPPRREQSGIFVANLLSLFFGNEQQTADLCREVGRLESYGGRLIPILGLLFEGDSPNHVVLEQPPDQALLRYFSADLGLRLPEIHTLPHAQFVSLAHAQADSRTVPVVTALQHASPSWLDGFVTDDALLGLARRIGQATLNSRDSSYAGNHKVQLHHFLVQNDLPVFDTELSADLNAVQAGLQKLQDRGYSRAVVKTAIGASGIGIWPITPGGTLDHLPPYLFYDGPCLVQGWLDAEGPEIDAVHSPSVQLFLNDDAVHLYDLTDQILSAESVHQGNLSPPLWIGSADDPSPEILRQARLVGRWLHDQNYRGTASVDFHVTVRHGAAEVRVCEVNARVTGATYPALLASHFNPSGAWLMRNIRFDPPTPTESILGRMRQHDLLFFPSASAGVIPLNFNNQSDGKIAKGQFLCLAPDPPAVSRLLARLQTILPVHHLDDRD